MAVKFSNNASTLLSNTLSASSPTAECVSLSAFPSLGAGDYTYATIAKTATPSDNEIVKITAITGNTATIVRSQQGTTALAFGVGDTFELRMTAGLVEDYVAVKSVLDVWPSKSVGEPIVVSWVGNSNSGGFLTEEPDVALVANPNVLIWQASDIDTQTASWQTADHSATPIIPDLTDPSAPSYAGRMTGYVKGQLGSPALAAANELQEIFGGTVLLVLTTLSGATSDLVHPSLITAGIGTISASSDSNYAISSGETANNNMWYWHTTALANALASIQAGTAGMPAAFPNLSYVDVCGDTLGQGDASRTIVASNWENNNNFRNLERASQRYVENMLAFTQAAEGTTSDPALNEAAGDGGVAAVAGGGWAKNQHTRWFSIDTPAGSELAGGGAEAWKNFDGLNRFSNVTGTLYRTVPSPFGGITGFKVGTSGSRVQNVYGTQDYIHPNTISNIKIGQDTARLCLEMPVKAPRDGITPDIDLDWLAQFPAGRPIFIVGTGQSNSAGLDETSAGLYTNKLVKDWATVGGTNVPQTALDWIKPNRLFSTVKADYPTASLPSLGTDYIGYKGGNVGNIHLAMAEYIAEKSGRNVYVLQVSRDGGNSDYWDSTSGSTYGTLNTQMTAVLATQELSEWGITSPDILNIMQGESDADPLFNATKDANSWATDWLASMKDSNTKWFEDYRTRVFVYDIHDHFNRLDNPTNPLPPVDANNNPILFPPYKWNGASALAVKGGSFFSYVSSTGLAHQGDGIHFDGDATNLFGEIGAKELLGESNSSTPINDAWDMLAGNTTINGRAANKHPYTLKNNNCSTATRSAGNVEIDGPLKLTAAAGTIAAPATSAYVITDSSGNISQGNSVVPAGPFNLSQKATITTTLDGSGNHEPKTAMTFSWLNNQTNTVKYAGEFTILTTGVLFLGGLNYPYSIMCKYFVSLGPLPSLFSTYHFISEIIGKTGATPPSLSNFDYLYPTLTLDGGGYLAWYAAPQTATVNFILTNGSTTGATDHVQTHVCTYQYADIG